MKRIILCVALAALMVSSMVGAANAKTKIVWWGWFPTQEDFAVIKEGFEKQYPDLELEATRFMWDDYVNKLKLEFSSGAGPDVMSMKDGSLLNDFKPYLLDLTQPTADIQKQLVPTIVQDAVAKSGGKELYLIPLGMSSQMFIYYNATLFEKAGVKVPTNAEEFAAATDALKKAYPDKLTLAIGLKDGWFATDFFLMLANMVSPGITEKADRGEAKWNSEEFVKAMNILVDLTAKDIIPKSSIALAEYEDAIGLLMDGKAIMHANGSWNAGNLSLQYGDRRRGRATDNDVFGAFPMPNFAGGNPVVIGGTDIGMAINKNSKNADAAVKLIEYMALGAGRDYFTGRPGNGLIPSKAGVTLNMEAYPDQASKDGAQAMVDAYGKYMVATREVANTAVKNQLAVALQNIINGSDIQKELDEIQRIAEREE